MGLWVRPVELSHEDYEYPVVEFYHDVWYLIFC